MMKNYKKIIVSFVLLLLIISGGCSNEKEYWLGYSALKYVDLFDYESISVSKNFIEVSEDEIETVIEADLDSRGIYKRITSRNTVENGDIVLCDIYSDIPEYNLSDYYYFTDSDELSEDISKKIIGMKKGEKLSFKSNTSKGIITNGELYIKDLYKFAQADDEKIVLEMYSCDSMEDVHKYVEEKTRDTIILNYAIDKIMKYSSIKSIPKQANEYVENKLEEIKTNYSGDNTENLEEYLGMTLEEYKEYNYSMYFEYMIYVAIAEKENIIFSQKDFDNTISIIANMEGISEKEVLLIYDKEYIIYETIVDEIEKILLEAVEVV